MPCTQPGWLNTLAQLPAEAVTQAEFFSANAELQNPESVEILHEEVVRSIYADPGRAERLALAARRLADDLNNPASRAAALRAMGHVSYAGSRYEDAVRFYGEALEILGPMHREIECGRTLLSGLQPLIYLGRYQEAFAWAERAREIFERQGDRLRLARLATNIGNIYYRQDHYAEALTIYEDAYSRLSSLGEPRDIAAVLSNIAVCNISLGRFAKALEFYRDAREYCVRAGLPLLVAGADYNIAYLHYLEGDFLSAVDMYKASREHCRAAGDHYHAALCNLDEAEIYLELNLSSEAMRLAERAEQGFEALSMPYERAKAMVIHALAAGRRGQAGIARRLFSQARKLFAAEQNLLWPALIDLHRAILLEREDRNRQAAVLCRRASRLLVGSALAGQAGLAELLQCRLLLKTGQTARARKLSAAICARLEETGTPSLRFHAWFTLGQAEEQSGNDAAAFSAYRSARREIEILRSRLWGDEPRISFLKDKLAVYEGLVRICLADVHRPRRSVTEAFGYIQQAKSRSLADLISHPWSVAERADSEHQDEIQDTRRSLDSQYRRMAHLALSAKSANNAQIQTIKQNVREWEDRLANLMADVEPGGAGITPSPESLAVETIQAAIPAGSMLLEYYVVKGVLYVCLVDKSGLEFVPLGQAEEIRTIMRLLRFQLCKVGLAWDNPHVGGRATEKVVNNHLRELYDRLLAPVRNRLAKTRHLIFAPHDFLHHLPFHALRARDRYVIDEFTASYTPSATVFALCSARQPEDLAQSLVLGLPDELAPHIAMEVQAAAAALPGARLFQGEDAREEVVRRLGPASRFIHIAAHGLFRRDNPLFSAIRLGDSHLTLLDLYRLPLSAELVTLSGCSTGMNVVVGGDELLGLMRGLLLAGARCVMVSLWDVNDLSTAEFMRRFYRHLPAAPHKAAALQAAVQELREEYSHPFYWAHFVLAGKYGAE